MSSPDLHPPYEALSNGCIRVLRLRGTTLIQRPDAKRSAPPDLAIVCEMDQIQIQGRHRHRHKHKYAALSYCWGQSTNPQYIVCNDVLMPVTQNLYHALLQFISEMFWDESPHREPQIASWRLWIDAVCINQQDLSEKNQQVAMMGDIYRTASLVVVWLGTASHLAGTEARFLDSLSASRRPSMDERSWIDGLAFLERNSWFHRAWTFQEIVLARSAVVRYGQHFLDWQLLMEKVTVLRRDESDDEHDDMTALDGHYHERWQNHLPSASHMSQIARVSSYTIARGRGKIPWKELLIASADREATMPCDKIFSLQGLCSPELNLPAPDYNQPIHSVHFSAACAILQETSDPFSLLDIGWLLQSISEISRKPHKRHQLVWHQSELISGGYSSHTQPSQCSLGKSACNEFSMSWVPDFTRASSSTLQSALHPPEKDMQSLSSNSSKARIDGTDLVFEGWLKCSNAIERITASVRDPRCFCNTPPPCIRQTLFKDIEWERSRKISHSESPYSLNDGAEGTTYCNCLTPEEIMRASSPKELYHSLIQHVKRKCDCEVIRSGRDPDYLLYRPTQTEGGFKQMLLAGRKPKLKPELRNVVRWCDDGDSFRSDWRWCVIVSDQAGVDRPLELEMKFDHSNGTMFFSLDCEGDYKQSSEYLEAAERIINKQESWTPMTFRVLV